VDKAQGEDGQGYWASWAAKAATNVAAADIIKRYHTRPAEELYDLNNDPWEQHNLAGLPAQAQRLAQFRAELDAWMKEQGDQGLPTETARRPKPPAEKAKAGK
jgi:uncharacterized sulfatase